MKALDDVMDRIDAALTSAAADGGLAAVEVAQGNMIQLRSLLSSFSNEPLKLARDAAIADKKAAFAGQRAAIASETSTIRAYAAERSTLQAAVAAAVSVGEAAAEDTAKIAAALGLDRQATAADIEALALTQRSSMEAAIAEAAAAKEAAAAAEAALVARAEPSLLAPANRRP